MTKNNKKKKRNVKKPKYQKTYTYDWYKGISIFGKILIFPFYLIVLLIELIFFPLHKVFSFLNRTLFNENQLSKMREKNKQIDSESHFLYITKYNPITKNIKGVTQTSISDIYEKMDKNKSEQIKNGNLIIDTTIVPGNRRRPSAISAKELDCDYYNNKKLNFKEAHKKNKPRLVDKKIRNKVNSRIKERLKYDKRKKE